MGRSWALSEIVVPKPSYCFSAFRTSDFLSANLSRSNKSPEARRISITASIFFSEGDQLHMPYLFLSQQVSFQKPTRMCPTGGAGE